MTASGSGLPLDIVARGANSAVVAPHHLASQAGLAVLMEGGSAVDAAIATSAVLGVVQPDASGIGGDAFWLIWDESARELTALNGSGRTGRRADARSLRGRGLSRVPERGPLSITVPGACHAWSDAHRRFGSIGFKRLLAPAVELARDGFPMWPELARVIEATRDAIAGEPWADGFESVFRPHGRPWRIGELIRQPTQAATLERLATDGPAAFYDGDIGARQVEAFEQLAVPLDGTDLSDHRSTWDEPIWATFRDLNVAAHPPNSSGVVMLELLTIVDALPLATGLARRAESIHQGVEAAKVAMADRNRYLGDPAFGTIPVAELLDRQRAASLAAAIGPMASGSSGATARDGDTAFLAAVDRRGNAVSLIQSLYSVFGSGVVDPATGITYQNRGTYLWLTDDHPNRLEPAKRPLHTLLPAMAFRDDRPWLVIGSMGGDAQPQIVGQVLASIVDDGMGLWQALDRPRWYARPPGDDQTPDRVLLETRTGDHVVADLERRGHRVELRPDYDRVFGHCHVIELVEGGPVAGGSLAAATDPRSAGLPAVW